MFFFSYLSAWVSGRVFGDVEGVDVVRHQAEALVSLCWGNLNRGNNLDQTYPVVIISKVHFT